MLPSPSGKTFVGMDATFWETKSYFDTPSSPLQGESNKDVHFDLVITREIEV